MIGVGKIYTCFKEGVIEADDEVAVAVQPNHVRACMRPTHQHTRRLTLTLGRFNSGQ